MQTALQHAPALDITPDIDVVIEDEGWHAIIDSARPEEWVRLTAARTFALAMNHAPETTLQNRPVMFSVILADNAMLQELNRDWRDKDSPTNVLSFAMNEGDALTLPPDIALPLGDIYLARETILSEAESQARSVQNHTRHLIIHGVLHLLGYDHIDDDAAEIMQTLECAILAQFGIEDPYILPLDI